VTIEALLEGSSPTVAALTHRLVALVQARAPTATVSVKPGWRLVGFTLQRYFCAVAPAADTVDLLFEQGVALPDPDRRLIARGRQVRALRFSSDDDVDEGLIHAFVDVAILTQKAPLRRRSP
jgi:hypothetical protein